MRILLAPMDGLTDVYVRELLTRIGGFDLCVTEFLRVTDTLFPDRVFYRRFPELLNHKRTINNPSLISHTKVGVPVYLQLLGSDPIAMSENAEKAARLGAVGIDLNFGCPAKTVNKRDGGASLLKFPHRIYDIVKQVRKTVPPDIPVTAKMRLGYDDSSLLLENAAAIQDAGAHWITIHARTKKDGYKPPAYWDDLAPVNEKLSIPVIANGEIWSVDDYKDCKQRSGCTDIMLGRGAMVTPDLARQIKHRMSNDHQAPLHPLSWQQICAMLEQLAQLMMQNPNLPEKYIAPRIKLWVKWLMPNYSEAVEIFPQLKRIQSPGAAVNILKNSINGLI